MAVHRKYIDPHQCQTQLAVLQTKKVLLKQQKEQKIQRPALDNGLK
jgi:hypothetical protein